MRSWVEKPQAKLISFEEFSFWCFEHMNNCTANQEKILNVGVLYCMFDMQTLDIIYQYIYTRVHRKGGVPVLLFKSDLNFH